MSEDRKNDTLILPSLQYLDLFFLINVFRLETFIALFGLVSLILKKVYFSPTMVIIKV